MTFLNHGSGKPQNQALPNQQLQIQEAPRRKDVAGQALAAGDQARDRRGWVTTAEQYAAYLDAAPQNPSIWVQ